MLILSDFEKLLLGPLVEVVGFELLADGPTLGRGLVERDGIDVGAEDALDGPPGLGQAHGLSAVNTNDLNAVTGPDAIDHIVIDEKGDGVGGLTLGDGVWGLLELDELLVGKLATVVDQDV